jgi:pyruvate/2-oxoglutarate dehydrogenase complex dihydrolipoamide acyltransferase (E2) component
MMGPVARSMINEYNIDPSKVKGSGPHGIITKKYEP